MQAIMHPSLIYFSVISVYSPHPSVNNLLFDDHPGCHGNLLKGGRLILSRFCAISKSHSAPPRSRPSHASMGDFPHISLTVPFSLLWKWLSVFACGQGFLPCPTQNFPAICVNCFQKFFIVHLLGRDVFKHFRNVLFFLLRW